MDSTQATDNIPIEFTPEDAPAERRSSSQALDEVATIPPDQVLISEPTYASMPDRDESLLVDATSNAEQSSPEKPLNAAAEITIMDQMNDAINDTSLRPQEASFQSEEPAAVGALASTPMFISENNENSSIDNGQGSISTSEFPPLDKDVIPSPARIMAEAGWRENSQVKSTSILVAEENEDNEEIPATELPEHLLRPIQEAWFKQLSERNAALDLGLRERDEAVKQAMNRRETIGVELYALQQRLASLQQTLESAEGSYQEIRNFREEVQTILKGSSEKYQQQRQSLAERERTLDGHRQELEKITSVIKQVELYNEQLKSEIAVARRTTMKAEQDMLKQEMEKKRQDFFIDSLTEKCRGLKEQKILYESQHDAQQRETKAAQETLQDAVTEMEAIQFEKRQLLHQWKSSLLALQRRDEFLNGIEKDIASNKETIQNIQNELSAFRTSLRKAQEQAENLAATITKLETETDHVQRMLDSSADARAKLSQDHSTLSVAMSQTEQEYTRSTQERQSILLELNNLTKTLQKTNAEARKSELEVQELLQNQLAVTKGTHGAKRDITRVAALVSEKEALAAQIRNEISNAQLESLQVYARIQELEKQSSRIDDQAREREVLIQKYEDDIRKGQETLAKRQGEVEFLNKKYDQLISNQFCETTGPLEATITNLARSIATKEEECGVLQQQWLRVQNELVISARLHAEVADHISEARTRMAVLTRKRAVVNNAFETEEAEIRYHQRQVRQLQADMMKINTLAAKQSNIKSKIEESNLLLEHNFRSKLKEAELESVRLEQSIDDSKADRERALQGLVEAERQILLWQKKIQIAKETQAALDPDQGASEIREMTAEIHRMRLRAASLTKLQEQLVQEMERAVLRRGSIAFRAGVNKATGNESGKDILKRQAQDVGKKLKQAMSDAKAAEEILQMLRQSLARAAEQAQASEASCQSMESKEQTLIRGTQSKMAEKQLISTLAIISQKQAKRYEEIKGGSYKLQWKNPDNRVQELDKQYERANKVLDTIKDLESQYGQFISEFVKSSITASSKPSPPSLGPSRPLSVLEAS
ncbi:hypothetical protein SeMB42_g05780 [Synchytrium endobioticum]|uniref:Coiled-coil domain-containing protein 40 n=1 Tax=Synchytrium endobioticum TaxID=286115 RepID=A0A507DDZ0_9FUNG|nr:hypothetical protein SeMB42_g05780 [Synchytrium endobioticum]TPX49088.1 hypothetical protein SeLEV6574_g01687 [Synchytrium endobioticum]